jgi:Arc/MetJ-type ribon-helix-helix transcriptional regulator
MLIEDLPQDVADFIEKSTQSGAFGSDAEVCIYALRVMRDQPLSPKQRRGALQNELMLSAREIDERKSEPWNLEAFLTRMFDAHLSDCHGKTPC